ncbi:serine hydrolase domain-containing protein [Lacibacter sediminis]|uniref:Beta-lactamase family protein n=1 Tax=Lacibacter sediminis TaxID=2760713 RepID=A0A7G5XM86_9BACT|nr:serine hydrolase domain-containing protein [Lacibacter sediminis]QNA46589.1 beta-lactamase family protein [Lacibacter sediminis]
MARKRTFFYYIVATLLLSGCGASSAKKKDKAEQDIVNATANNLSKAEADRCRRIAEDFYDSSLKRTGFNGAMLVAKKGQIVFEQYNGFGHLKGKDSITPNTPFHIASTTKTFTAMAVLKLAEEGKLNINDSLQKFFPGFPYEGMTVKILLNQRSGLPNYAYYLEKANWDNKVKVTNEDVLQTLIQYKPDLQNAVNRRFNYSNTNFVLLALIIERVSGKSYADYLQEAFFTPLQMTNTKVFNRNDSATATPSYMWNGVQEAFTYLDVTYGDKNIYSTVRDLLKWDQALYGNKLFKQSTLDSAFQPYSFEKPGIHNYGFGWRMYTLANNNKIIYHNGWWHGNNSTFYRVLPDSLTIIILGNKFNRNIYRVKPLIEAMTPLKFSYGEE